MLPKTITIIPAYGRDYITAGQAKKDFFDGKDFLISDPSCEYDGKYCSIRDLKGYTVMIRYKQFSCITAVDVT